MTELWLVDNGIDVSEVFKVKLLQSHYDEDDKEDIDVYGKLSDDEDENDEEDIEGSSSASDDSLPRGYSVENSYNEEKEQACLALREICCNTG